MCIMDYFPTLIFYISFKDFMIIYNKQLIKKPVLYLWKFYCFVLYTVLKSHPVYLKFLISVTVKVFSMK